MYCIVTHIASGLEIKSLHENPSFYPFHLLENALQEILMYSLSLTIMPKNKSNAG